MKTLIFLAALLLPGTAFGGGVVYHCLSASGGAVYQDSPCSGKQEIVKVRPGPSGEAFAEATLRDLGHSAPRQFAPSTPDPVTPRPQPISYECQSADGEVFYRHDSCPPALPKEEYHFFAGTQTFDRYYMVPAYVPVKSTPVTRSSACSTIYAIDASSRNGNDLDQRYSTYDRNLGRDPCR